MPNANPIARVFSRLLGSLGFKGKKDTWYLNTPEVVQLVQLQKSQYGKQFYVNFGTSLRKLGTSSYPKENEAHIRFRLGSVIPDDSQKDLAAALDLESDLDDTARDRVLTDLLERFAFPILKECSTLAGVKRALKGGRLGKALVHVKVEEAVSDQH